MSGNHEVNLSVSESEARYGVFANRTAAVLEGLTIEDFEPQIGCILVEELPPEERIGIIEIPETFRKERNIGLVIGRNVHPDEPCIFEVGDLVSYFVGSGQSYVIGGKVYRVMEYMDRLSVFGRFRAAAVKKALDKLAAGPVKSQ